ncbi:MAG TPA: tRNA 2-thiouridine(34) synthase MnmA [Kofleriaceae bacterium]|jgi:tRNA-specific 2-thiouridylase|nr:tRNA 2-thiouridine(34) synthase MnmA [Kofleriaceae bacterium]
MSIASNHGAGHRSGPGSGSGPRATGEAGRPLIVAALSGGVDSATAAALLVEQGHTVVGMTMRLYDARGTAAAAGGRCCGPRDVEDARAVCAHLGIPHYVVDLAAEFGAAVVDDFVEAYLAGETPNPCVKCNQHIKFTPLLARARAIGAGVLVTGHYAQIVAGSGGGGYELRRGRDPGKDQSYFLFSMPAAELAAVQFPLGGMTKDEVRDHARRLGLPNAGKTESQEICFVPDGDHAGFVSAQALRRGRALPGPGAIIGDDGAVLGHHDGVHRFTLGQHRGLGTLITRDRLYVTAIDPARGEVRVGPRAAAERTELTIRDLRWLAPPQPRLSASVQVRHRGAPIPAQIRVEPADADASSPRAIVELAEPTVAAPGQAAVIYDGDRVLAGGWIARA